MKIEIRLGPHGPLNPLTSDILDVNIFLLQVIENICDSL